jgi:hypothetical protein
MSGRSFSVRKIIKSKYTPVFIFVFLILATVGVRYLWIKNNQEKFEVLNTQIQQYVEQTITRQQKISDRDLQGMIQNNPRIVYLVYQNQLDHDEKGFLNVKSFDLGAQKLGQYYNQHVTTDVLQKVIQDPEEFSGDYVRSFEKPVHQMMNGQTVKVGKISVAYLMPGYSIAYPGAGSYFDYFYKIWLAFLSINALAYPLYLKRRRKKSSTAASISEKDHLEWLEQDLVGHEIDEDTTRNDSVHKGGWIDLFNQADLNEWNVKGGWYVRDQMAIGFPWGSSITTQYEIPFEKYDFEVESQRMTGSDGFMVLFKYNGKPLTWVIGGWRNSRSEVAGYTSTATPDVLEKFRWYYVKIEADQEKIVGFLDGRKIWELQKKDVDHPSPDVGFQDGYGVGVWGSMARFQRIRIVSTE